MKKLLFQLFSLRAYSSYRTSQQLQERLPFLVHMATAILRIEESKDVK